MNIKTYAVSINGGPNGHAPDIVGVRAQIFLFPDSGTESKTISFFEPPHVLPEEAENSHMILPMSCYSAVMDLLRNEQPIKLIWLELEGWSLLTDYEGIGEGETKNNGGA